MKYMLDANCVINLFSGTFPKLNQRVIGSATGDIVISTIAYAEIALGSALGMPPEPDLLADFVAEIPLVNFDGAAAMAYARLPFKRGSFDRLIAAHAISLGVTVISRNIKDFANMPGLQVEDWTA
jgi:tRNA(fMet)-specific endonuclease VapC